MSGHEAANRFARSRSCEHFLNRHQRELEWPQIKTLVRRALQSHVVRDDIVERLGPVPNGQEP
jgi:hypothetical protein